MINMTYIYILLIFQIISADITAFGKVIKRPVNDSVIRVMSYVTVILSVLSLIGIASYRSSWLTNALALIIICLGSIAENTTFSVQTPELYKKITTSSVTLTRILAWGGLAVTVIFWISYNIPVHVTTDTAWLLNVISLIICYIAFCISVLGFNSESKVKKTVNVPVRNSEPLNDNVDISSVISPENKVSKNTNISENKPEK